MIPSFQSLSAAIALMLLSAPLTNAQSLFDNKKELFTTPRQYTAVYHVTAPVVDGKLNDPAWQNAPWTDYFMDIEGEGMPAPTWQTRAKMTWNSDGLYIAAHLEEPHVWAYLRNYDDIVFYDNDFEVFIDPDNDTHRYYEFEVNAVNTMFDLFMPKPYRNGSGAMIAYNAPGMKWAVDVQGTVNNPADEDKGWTVEMFIPFAAVTIGNTPKIPGDGEFWRIDFSRVEWDVEVKDGKYVKKKGANGRNLPEHNWVWSPQGVINMHYPERWGYVFFSKTDAGEKAKEYKIPYSDIQKKHLWLVYYLQKEYYAKHKAYAKDLATLGVTQHVFDVGGLKNTLWMEATSRQFMVYINSDSQVHTLNDEGLVGQFRK